MIDQEAGSICRARRKVTEALAQRFNRLAHGGAGFQPRDHLDDLHQGHGVEEMEADHPFRVRTGCGDFGNG